MAFAPIRDMDLRLTRGEFREADYGNWFNYSAPEEGEFRPDTIPAEYDVKVYVGDGNINGDQGFRWAKVLQTVAYIVTDEDENGNLVVEKWFLKSHNRYNR